ncbi:MAG TPA: hypothetical protein VF666_10045 [Pyrinomonadaceae bacterium]|jgi:hypothetical protein
MRRRIITLVIFAVAALAMFVCTRLSLNAEGAALSSLQRTARQRRVAPARSSSRATRNYGRFLHESNAHKKLSCNDCHKTPTSNWRTASGFPDVADYPAHDACINCHRQQFFKGARPVICTICHTRVSPRDESRFAFRHPSRARQFVAEFPHDKHQDVIARGGGGSFRPDASARTRFMPALFVATAHATQEKPTQYNNCAICHETNARLPAPPVGGWPDGFTPPAGTFKTVPTSHASCFNCHWKSVEPVRDNCAGCHKTASAASVALDASPRISNKFIHMREQHVAECTSCHIHITAATTLRGLKPDVPISTCAPCHKTSTDAEIVTLEKEFDRRKQDRNFTCAKCHTSEVGRRDVPTSHAALFE